MKKIPRWILGFALAYFLIGGVLDRVIFPEGEPGPAYYTGLA